jgi:hypothetical protein
MENHFFDHDHCLIFFCFKCGVGVKTTLFVGSCWGHAMFKCCQHATNDSKVCGGLTFIFIEETQSILQKTITLTKNNEKGNKRGTKHL